MKTTRLRRTLAALALFVAALTVGTGCTYRDFPLTHPPHWMYPKGCNVEFHGRFLVCPRPPGAP